MVLSSDTNKKNKLVCEIAMAYLGVTLHAALDVMDIADSGDIEDTLGHSREPHSCRL